MRISETVFTDICGTIDCAFKAHSVPVPCATRDHVRKYLASTGVTVEETPKTESFRVYQHGIMPHYFSTLDKAKDKAVEHLVRLGVHSAPVRAALIAGGTRREIIERCNRALRESGANRVNVEQSVTSDGGMWKRLSGFGFEG